MAKAYTLEKDLEKAAGAVKSGNLKEVGTTRIQATIGSSSSSSNSTSHAETNEASTVDTNNLVVDISGRGKDSDLNIIGSDVNVSGNASYNIEGDMNYAARELHNSQSSANKSSGWGAGVYADTSNAAGITVNANMAKGSSDGSSTHYANSHVKVAGTTTYNVGGDVTARGAVVTSGHVTGHVAGDMIAESLQDSSTYNSSRKNAGFNADLDLKKGVGSSLSVNGGKSNVNAEYKAVQEQTGFFNQSSDLNVDGKGVFKGAVFTTATPDANQTTFGKGIEVSDIQNYSNYDGSSIQGGFSVGKDAKQNTKVGSNGIGYGKDSDSQTSMTYGGVTGMAGNAQVTTANATQYAGVLNNNFNAAKVNREIGAQANITQAFGQEAPKAVANYADAQAMKFAAQGDQAEAAKWAEGGIYRVAMHTAIGALATDNVEGGLTTGGIAVAAPTINQIENKLVDKLVAAGVSNDKAQAMAHGVTDITLAAVGTASGLDTGNTAAAMNIDMNNRQLHADEIQEINKTAKLIKNQLGNSENYWSNLLYMVSYAHLDKVGLDKLNQFKKDNENNNYGYANTMHSNILADLNKAEAAYQSLKTSEGGIIIPGGTDSKPIYMFKDSGYFNASNIYNTDSFVPVNDGGFGKNKVLINDNSYYINREDNFTKDFLRDKLNASTALDRVEAVYPELYLIGVGDIVNGVKIASKYTYESISSKIAANAATKSEIEAAKISNNFNRDNDLFNIPSGRQEYYPNSLYKGSLLKVNKPDLEADALADRISGSSRVYFENDPVKREFDAVSSKYVAQAKPANYRFDQKGRKQARATFEAARDNNKSVYYYFNGSAHSDTIRKLNEYSKEYNVELIIDTKPLK